MTLLATNNKTAKKKLFDQNRDLCESFNSENDSRDEKYFKQLFQKRRHACTSSTFKRSDHDYETLKKRSDHIKLKQRSDHIKLKKIY